MADKKTSQETSGAPIQGADLWRIARSGSNYKLTSGELFSETISSIDFFTKASNSQLIAGRNYRVTGTGTSGAWTIIVTATDVDKYSTANHITNSGSGDVEGSLTVMDQFFNNNVSFLDNRGNLFLQNIITANLIGSYNIVEGFNGIGGSANVYCDNSYLKNVVIYNPASDMYIQNCSLENVTIITDGNGSPSLTGCNFKNCTLYFYNTIQFNAITIIADNNDAYEFDNVNLNGGTLIKGQFSTLEMNLDMGNPAIFDSANKTLILPLRNKWVGIYNMNNQLNNPETIGIITNAEQWNTPIMFKQKKVTGFTINIQHTNSISATGSNEICMASNSSSNDHLDSIDSYAIMKYDNINSIWRCENVVNFNA